MHAPLVITEASRRAIKVRASAVSQELRAAARQARRNQTPILYRISVIALAITFVVRDSIGRGLLLSFLALAVVPSLILVAYFSFIASSQYASEAKFSVRAGEPSLLDLMTSAAGGASMQRAQDTLIVTEYITSRTMVEELERRVNLQAIFSSPHIDYFSRFKSGRTIEDLTRYWKSKVHISIEYNSGIVTVETFAFSPDDALLLAKTVVALSENLINTMSNRAQNDLVSQSEKELARAEARLRQATATLTELRNCEGLIDPRQQADAISKLIDQIRLDRLKMEQDLTSLTQSMSATSPQAQIFRLRIQAANNQIASLESRLTDGNKGANNAISSSITRFDQIELERKLAERQYIAASSSLEAARTTAERQRLYLSTFVSPVLAHESTYPRRLFFSLLSIGGSFLLWAVCISLWIPIRSRLTGRARA